MAQGLRHACSAGRTLGTHRLADGVPLGPIAYLWGHERKITISSGLVIGAPPCADRASGGPVSSGSKRLKSLSMHKTRTVFAVPALRQRVSHPFQVAEIMRRDACRVRQRHATARRAAGSLSTGRRGTGALERSSRCRSSNIRYDGATGGFGSSWDPIRSVRSIAESDGAPS